jgi:thiol-disulfide isomerase/thioredoxin
MNRFYALALVVCLLPLDVALGQDSRGVLYDFSATWCGPCQQMAPLVEKLQREGLPVRKVDIDQHADLANKYNITGIPTFVLVIDGQEADRVSGRLTESDLRRMVARIPSGAPAIASPAPSAPKTPMSLPVKLGEPAPLTRPQPLRSQPEETRIVQEEPKKGLRDLMPFGKKNEEPPAVIRGNDSPLAMADAPVRTAGLNASSAADPMAGSVRIRVITNGRIDLGSGTVVSSATGHTLILTCAHIFKEFGDDSRIEVDLFDRGRPSQYIARLVRFDAASDLGLISIPTAGAAPAVTVATRAASPRVGEPVAAIGCSGGDEPTRQQLRVTDIDKYDGPHNILCNGVPVRGRSGGGLFNRRGEIVGVCSAADEPQQRGFYSGLHAIHALLDQCSLSSLYAPEEEPAPQAPPVRLAAVEASSIPAALEPAPLRPADVSLVPAAVPASRASQDVQTGDAEVVVIIRDKSRPQSPNRVVIIHEASPKFLSYLSGELQQSVPVSDLLGDADAAPQLPLSAPHRAAATVEKPALLPTALSQPEAPQRYLRSASAAR